MYFTICLRRAVRPPRSAASGTRCPLRSGMAWARDEIQSLACEAKRQGSVDARGPSAEGPLASELDLQLQLVADGTHAGGLARELGGAVLDLDGRDHAHERHHPVVGADADARRLELLVGGHAVADRLRDLVVLHVRGLTLHVGNDLERVPDRLHAIDTFRDLFRGDSLLGRSDLAAQGDDAALRLYLDLARLGPLVRDQLHLRLGGDPGVFDPHPTA